MAKYILGDSISTANKVFLANQIGKFKIDLKNEKFYGGEIKVSGTKDNKVILIRVPTVGSLAQEKTEYFTLEQLNENIKKITSSNEFIVQLNDFLRNMDSNKLILINIDCIDKCKEVAQNVSKIVNRYPKLNLFISVPDEHAYDFLDLVNINHKKGISINYIPNPDIIKKKIDFFVLDKKLAFPGVIEELFSNGYQIFIADINNTIQEKTLNEVAGQNFKDLYIIRPLIW
ncbi:MAG: hypothetical protein ACK5HL_02130 [Bacilli bacterium]